MTIDAARFGPVTRLGAAAGLLTTVLAARPQLQTAAARQTRVVLLGTGSPAADPDRSGPATATVVNDTPYLVDFGPGVIRRAKGAVVERGIAALEPTNLRVVFATHLHSDHTVGYPDLIFSPGDHRRLPRLRCAHPRSEYHRVGGEARCDVPGVRREVPHLDRPARGAGRQGQAPAAGAVPSLDRAASRDHGDGLNPGSTVSRDQQPLFRSVRGRSRSGCLLKSTTVVSSLGRASLRIADCGLRIYCRLRVSDCGILPIAD
jgi:hypothetical protein